jgi:hypothetical protein
MEFGNLRHAIDFTVATTFLPTHPEKLAIYLANGAQTYATRLMKRSSIRSAYASLAKGYRKLKTRIGR